MWANKKCKNFNMYNVFKKERKKEKHLATLLF